MKPFVEEGGIVRLDTDTRRKQVVRATGRERFQQQGPTGARKLHPQDPRELPATKPTGCKGGQQHVLQGQGREEPGQSGVEPIDSKNYRCCACGATYFTTSALRNHKVNKHIEVKETFLRALLGKDFMREADMESHVPPQPPANSKNKIAQRQDQEIGDGPPLGVPRQQKSKGSRASYQSRRPTPSSSNLI